MKIIIEGVHPLFKDLRCELDLDKPDIKHYEECLNLIIIRAEMGGYSFSIKRSPQSD